MLILVANLGSTSFKYKLLDMSRGGAEVAKGGYERIGQAGAPYADHGAVIDVILKELPGKVDAIGFKAVHGGPISGAVRVTDDTRTPILQHRGYDPPPDGIVVFRFVDRTA